METDINSPSRAATKYYALLVANNEYTGDNDKVKTAMLDWNSWKTTGTITLKDNLSGPGIIKEIKKWVVGIGPDDVAVFYYSGHGGVRGDVGGEERFNDPVADNDVNPAAPASVQKLQRDSDEVMGKLNAKKRFPVWATDDQIKVELGSLPASTTLIAVFDMCKAFGNAGGTSDTDVLINTAVIAACAENRATGAGWTKDLIKGLFDGNGNGKAEADDAPTGNGNGQITAQEWFDWVDTQDGASLFTSNLAGGADRPIFTGLNNEQAEPGAGPAKDKGEDGSGICSEHDFGDAPDNGQVCGPVPRFYNTTSANNGPRYNEWTFQRLGAAVDPELDGQPGCPAAGDGTDEDGVVFFGPPINAVSVTVRIDHVQVRDYRLDAWFDANENGMFDEPSEHLIDSQANGLLAALSTGTYTFFYSLTVNPIDVYSRFRLTFGVDPSTAILSTGEYVGPDGNSHGEVEDYPPGSGGATIGACCEPDGTCVDNLTQAVCEGLHGTYQGDNSSCATVVCEPAPTGACCLPDGACIDTMIQPICDDAEGTYQGDDTTCDTIIVCNAIPTPAVSEWGLVVMSLLALTAGTLLYARRRLTPA